MPSVSNPLAVGYKKLGVSFGAVWYNKYRDQSIESRYFWQKPPELLGYEGGFLFPEKSKNPENFFLPKFGLDIKKIGCIIRV